MNKLCGIYKITNVKNKVYIGYSKDIEKRFGQYRTYNTPKQIRLHRSLKKYGIEDHTFEILELCNFEELCIRERYWQDFYDVLNEMGLNCNLTATNEKPKEVSQETRDKIGAAHKGKFVSQETKDKLSKANKGKKDRKK